MQQSEPFVERLAGNFKLTWYSLGMRVEVSHVVERFGRTWGEFHVIALTEDGEETILRFEDFNLKDSRDKEKLARRIVSRFGVSEYDSVTIVESCFVTVMEMYREGDPLLTITGERKPGLNKFRSYPILLEGQPNVLFADGDSGKSMIADYIAVLMDTPPLEKALWSQRTEPGAVLVLDWETDEDEFANRVAAIKRGLGIPDDAPLSIKYIRMGQPLEHEIDRIQQVVLDEKIDLVIVDSMEMAISGSSNDAQPITNLYNALRTLNTTSLILDHINKEGNQVGNRYKHNFARNSWRLESSQIPGTDNVTIGFFHEKHNNTKRLPAFAIDMNFTLDDEGEMESLVFKQGDIGSVLEFQGRRSTNERIADELKVGAKTVGELAGLLDKDENSIRTTLNRGKDKRFTKVDDTRWGLYFRGA